MRDFILQRLMKERVGLIVIRKGRMAKRERVSPKG